MLNPLEVLETLRCRAMYGDNYNPEGMNTWQPSHWAAALILAAASNHLQYGRAYKTSIVAEYTAQQEYFAWCDETNNTGKTHGQLLAEGFSANDLGGLKPEWTPEFWQNAALNA